MPAKRVTMRKITDIPRLKWSCELSHRQVSAKSGSSPTRLHSPKAVLSPVALTFAITDSEKRGNEGAPLFTVCVDGVVRCSYRNHWLNLLDVPLSLSGYGCHRVAQRRQ